MVVRVIAEQITAVQPFNQDVYVARILAQTLTVRETVDVLDAIFLQSRNHAGRDVVAAYTRRQATVQWQVVYRDCDLSARDRLFIGKRIKSRLSESERRHRN